MATGVGLRIAEDECTAVIVTDGDEEPQYIVRESALHMSDDGDAVLGGPVPAGRSHSITGFVPAVGDPAGISVDDGEAYRAEDLMATALFCLINLTAEHLNGPAEFYATHPGDWPAEHVRSLREALDYLGLRSVLLVSEGDLPSAGTGANGGVFAYDAARAALAAVLATPAGATPPDPSTAENSLLDTIVMPAVPAAQPQAYSAAIPVATPVATSEPAAPEKPIPATTPAKDRERAPVLIAVAALIGLILGGIAVTALFRNDGDTPVPPLPDAKSEQSSVSLTPPAPPVEFPTVPVTTPSPEPPVITPETTTPETTTPPPETTEPPTTAPTTTTRPTRTPTTTTNPFYGPIQPIPTFPGWIPGSR
ncbi:hypothetical protein OHB12_23455 [Nocardia sp. NBC_01730]|uniref:hypothetical protein n=1 Tax=Nocardia sp. NBC_01730 TaxID=2975998 RepID=UPI002E127F1C|nr:hypothetical protein OHB12_23455 [Nocardia sp. NBC_01730]